MSARLFGSIALEGDGGRLGVRDFGGVKPRQVFSLLLLARGRPVSKDRLADAIWGEELPRNVAGTLESYISVLRSRLATITPNGRALVVTQHEAYRVAFEAIDLDLDRFDQLVRRAGASAPAHRLELLEHAIELAGGAALADEPYADWAADVRDAYAGRVVAARLDAARAALDIGEPRRAADHADAALAADPLDEEAAELAVAAHTAAGRPGGAMRAFERHRAAADAAGFTVAELVPAPAPAARRGATRSAQAGVLVVTVLAALGELAPDLRLGDLRQTLGEGASLEPLLAMLPHTAAASLRARLDGDR